MKPALHPKSPVPTYHIGIVGGGFGALMTYVTLRFRGVRAAHIRIFSPDRSPEASWHSYVRSIGQKTLRSESVAHFFPADSPGLATYEAFATWSIKPLILSWFDLYHPSVEFFVQHVLSIARLSGFWQSSEPCRVARIEKENSQFLLYEENETQPCARLTHLVLAIGHGPVKLPAAVQEYRQHYPYDDRVMLAFAKKEYEPQATVVVIGDGLTSATEWINILERGGKVIAISMRGFTFGQPLNTPRRFFSKRGFAPYQGLPDTSRLQALRDATKGTIPGYRYWKKMFAQAVKEGKLEFIHGDVQEILQEEEGLRCVIRLADGHSIFSVDANQIISATGFYPPTSHPLLSTLITRYNLETVEDILRTDTSSCIPGLTSLGSVASVVGPAAAWTLPCADSIGGMKITARRIAERILGPETFTPRELLWKLRQWSRLVTRAELL